MSGAVALKAAYAVTWIIELGYLRYLLVRYRRTSKELQELKRPS